MAMSMENRNIALKLPQLALERPHDVAVSAPINSRPPFQYESLTFKELDQLSTKYAHGLLDCGLKKGDKVLMFVRPSVRFSALAFAIFRAGLIPIFIDPGMGRENLLQAVSQIRPDALIAEPEVHFLRLIFSKPFKSVKTFVTTGKFKWGKMLSLCDFTNTNPDHPTMVETTGEDTAAILFTSGGTGIPKGVRYTHDIFNAQVDRLREMFQLSSQEVDLPGFPLFSLFTITMGMKSAIPAMNPSKPAQCNPSFLVANILDHKASFVAGSPSIWKRVAEYCLKENISLPSVKYLVMFGAPVSLSLHKDLKKILPNGDTYTPYGATECLPVSCVSGEEVLNLYQEKMRQGHGTCVGKAVPETIIKIAPITEEALETENFAWLSAHQLGEICVKTQTVTPEYVGMPDKTKLAKIKANDGNLWHRMGDLGYLDESGVLWFCGRKSHRVTLGDKTLPSVPQESFFLENPLVNKAAFVGPLINKKIQPSLVIEPKRRLQRKEREALKKELSEMAKNHIKEISSEHIYFAKSFPVDVRHNIKIDRLKIKEAIEKGQIR